jgi:hypothetical protein
MTRQILALAGNIEDFTILEMDQSFGPVLAALERFQDMRARRCLLLVQFHDCASPELRRATFDDVFHDLSFQVEALPGQALT